MLGIVDPNQGGTFEKTLGPKVVQVLFVFCRSVGTLLGSPWGSKSAAKGNHKLDHDWFQKGPKPVPEDCQSRLKMYLLATQFPWP